uniref:Uncharacterized protein n=1 Tax=Oryza sativa subsp. japonica TaxID=39947 RepID=Q651H9_ORYSJ|nr:hypothetical protein [Oryza sativa Japonica Group]
MPCPAAAHPFPAARSSSAALTLFTTPSPLRLSFPPPHPNDDARSRQWRRTSRGGGGKADDHHGPPRVTAAIGGAPLPVLVSRAALDLLPSPSPADRRSHPPGAAAHLAVSTPDFDATAGALFMRLGGRARSAVEGGATALASDEADAVPSPPFLCLVGLMGGGRRRSPDAAPPPTSPVAGRRRPPPPVG